MHICADAYVHHTFNPHNSEIGIHIILLQRESCGLGKLNDLSNMVWLVNKVAVFQKIYSIGLALIHLDIIVFLMGLFWFFFLLLFCFLFICFTALFYFLC
jgi:hypothetical protein